MFNKYDLVMILKALVLQEKSVLRLAGKDEQPESVAAEYRKVASEIAELMKKCNLEIAKLEAKK